MVYGRFATEKADLETANEIIRTVFEEELGFPEQDEEEEFILSAIVFTGDPDQTASGEGAAAVPAGAGRLVFDGTRVFLGEVAVLPPHRGQAYGDFLVRLLIDRAAQAGAAEVRIDALAGTEDFFAGIGFLPEGEPFERAGGMWQPMVLVIDEMPRCEGCQP